MNLDKQQKAQESMVLCPRAYYGVCLAYKSVYSLAKVGVVLFEQRLVHRCCALHEIAVIAVARADGAKAKAEGEGEGKARSAVDGLDAARARSLDLD